MGLSPGNSTKVCTHFPGATRAHPQGGAGGSDLGRGRASAREAHSAPVRLGSHEGLGKPRPARGVATGADPRQAGPGRRGMGNCTHSLSSAAAAAPRAALRSRRSAIFPKRAPRPLHLATPTPLSTSPRLHSGPSPRLALSLPRPSPPATLSLLPAPAAPRGQSRGHLPLPARAQALRPRCHGGQSRGSEWMAPL